MTLRRSRHRPAEVRMIIAALLKAVPVAQTLIRTLENLWKIAIYLGHPGQKFLRLRRAGWGPPADGRPLTEVPMVRPYSEGVRAPTLPRVFWLDSIPSEDSGIRYG